MNSKLIKNLELSNPSVVPEKLLFREKEHSQLVTNLKNSINTAVYGQLGSGKTFLLKKAIQELSSPKEKIIYIDCSLYQTANAVLREVLIDRPIASRSNYDLLKRLIERARNNKFTICFDHTESLRETEIIAQLIQIGVCVVVVCNSKDFLSSLDLRARIGLASLIELLPYTADEAFQLLRQMTSETLSTGYTDESLKLIAEKSKGNLTLAYNILKTGVHRATQDKKSIEEINLNDILLEHDCPQKLNQDEKLLLRILQEWKSLPASRLYDFYIQQSRHPKSERALRNYMENLCSKGLVKAIGEKRGRVYEAIETG